MTKPLIFLVEDDAIIAELLTFNLEGADYSARSFRDGQLLFQVLANDTLNQPALFILDLMLPGMDGFEICARLRSQDKYDMIPIMMLTARSSENDKVRGLETGADDYLAKPFSMRELLARIQALLRRSRTLRDHLPLAGASSASGQVACGIILLDDARHRVYKNDKEVELTNREYELLKYLMIHRGVAYSRDDLLNHVWGYEYGGETRTVDVHIRLLRRKIEDDDAHPVMIETVRGRGYRFSDRIQP